MRILFDHRATARRIHHDRFDTRLDVRPPRVDVVSDFIQRGVVIVQVMLDGATTARRRRDDLDLERIQHAGRRGIDAR